MNPILDGNFNPAFHFLGLIQKAIADGITRHCVHPGCPDVYLVPSEQRYYTEASNIEALQALCLAAPFDLRVESVPDWRPDGHQEVQVGRMLIHQKNPATAPKLAARPLHELLWYATLCASSGQLLQGRRADIPVRLTSSPDFSRLFHREHDQKLAAFMVKQSAPLTSIAESTGVPIAQVFDFYNACAVLDLIEVEQGNVFIPANHLIGLLEKTRIDRQARRCALPGQASLFLVPSEGKYYSEADSAGIARVCAAQLSKIEVSLIDNSDEEEVVQVGRMMVRRKKETAIPKIPARPLSELVFRAAFYASQGRLLPGYELHKPVRLKEWPDKTVLRESAFTEEERYFFPLAAYMTTHTASLPDIAEATRLPLTQVIDFHNACALSGLL